MSTETQSRLFTMDAAIPEPLRRKPRYMDPAAKHYHLWRIKSCERARVRTADGNLLDADGAVSCTANIGFDAMCAGIYAKRDDAAHKYHSGAHKQARREGLAKGEFFTQACDCDALAGE